MTEKVKITQEQATEIELQKKELKKHDIVARRILTNRINRYFHSMTVDEVIKALYIGYEVEPDFEVGDWVYVDWSDSKAKRRVFKVERTKYEFGKIEIDNDTSKYPNTTPPLDIVRHATPEEIAKEKERRWWDKHGREPWELKASDIVYSNVTKTYDKIVFVFRNGSVNLDGTAPNKFNQYGVNTIPKKELNNHNFKVVCFAEDRKDVQS